MIFPEFEDVLELHRRLIEHSGGSTGLRDRGLLESALAQPRMTFGGQDLYPTIVEKASSYCFSLCKGHAFIDGNKRIGHAGMEQFLVTNGFELAAGVDEQESIILRLAASDLSRDDFTEWLRGRIVPMIG